MHCPQCGLWELAAGDLVCSWCGTSYLRFAVALEPAELSTEDYPPPVELRVRNESPMGTITLDRIQTGQDWVTLVPGQPLPQTIPPGIEHIFYLDVDTFAAGVAANRATVAVGALYAAEVQTATLRLHQPETTGI